MVESIATAFNLTQGFPVDVFHPVYGKRTLGEYGDIKKLPGIMTDWFRTAADADAARTQPEADAVIAHHQAMRVQEHIARAKAADQGEDAKPEPMSPDTGHVVRDSVQAQEAADRLAISMVTSGVEEPIVGPTEPPLVTPRPNATEGFDPPKDSPAQATDPKEVSELTREAAATEIVPEPGQQIDLAAGGTEAAEEADPPQTMHNEDHKPRARGRPKAD